MLQGSQKTINNYLIKQLPTAAVFVDKGNTIIYVSDLWLGNFNFDTSIIGQNILDTFKNFNRDLHKSILEALTATSTFIHNDKNKRWIELHSKPWNDENENLIGTILQADNVTQRVLNEIKLEKLEIISKDIAEITEIGFWDYNLDKDKMTWDNHTKEIHELPEDYRPNFVDALNFYKLGYSRNTITMVVNKAITDEIPFSEKLQLITAEGNEIWVIASGKPLYENGEFAGMIGTIQNINQHHINEAKTKENERLLRTLIDNLPLCVSIKDLESRKILVNKSEMDFHNINDEREIIGKDNFHLFDNVIAEESRKDDLMVMRDLKPILGKEVSMLRPSGETVTHLISKMPLIDTDGHAYGLVSIRMDVTELKKKEVELRKLIDVTTTQNEKLINFAHIVSHNLRSHSANFSMLLDFLLQETSKKEQEKITKMLLHSSNNLLETLDNLNEVVDITTNTNLKKEHISINKKLSDIQQNLGPELKQHQVQIVNNIKDDVTIKVVPAYLESILINLITNGIKYKASNRDSFIKFRANKIKGYTLVSIEDNGIGIDLDKYGDKIFGMYKTFHTNQDSRGIGLYISKNQIEAMNGKITVKSKVDQGTTFKIYFNDKN